MEGDRVLQMKGTMMNYKESHFLVNGKKELLPEFSMDIGELPPGGKIEVVAVGKDGTQSASLLK